jgi:nicotinate-nucleotide pyrophosphorylase (carboxylating)
MTEVNTISTMEIKEFDVLLEMALAEDLLDVGDVTSNAIFIDREITAVLKSKDTGVLAGIDFFSRVFPMVDPEIQVKVLKQDGSKLKPGDEVATVTGNARTILTAERTGINFLSFLSGIATAANRCAEAAREKGHAVILDTRKTLPGYRKLSKYAVKAGGGENHRMGLFDMVMIKDNHIDAAGGITEAVEKILSAYGKKYRIEVECRNIDEVKEALQCDIDVIMLDNMSASECAEAVKLRKEGILFEVSGNMTLERIREYSPIGIDFISLGSLTHSVSAFDFSLGMD